MPAEKQYDDAARALILSVYQQYPHISDSIRILRNIHGIPISAATLYRRLGEWEIQPKHRTQTKDTPELRIRLRTLFAELNASDQLILDLLQLEGFEVTKEGMLRLRRKLGLKRRMSKEEYAELHHDYRHHILKELDKGTIALYGRGHLYTHFRGQGVFISRNRMFNIVRELDPVGVEQRRSLTNPNRRRGEYIVPGPNFLWSIDGHMKLQHWGFEIYAAIDAYSRHVVWAYIGFSARTNISVFRMYTDVVAELKYIPRVIRSDRGSETILIADAHYQLSDAARGPDTEPLGFKDCFLYGTSTANERIEAWWGQMSKSVLRQWREYFTTLGKDQLWDKDNIADRIALLAVYMPILRRVVYQFVHQWNRHRIRKQKGPSGVYGIPYMLYNYPELNGHSDYSVLVDFDLLDKLQGITAEYDPDLFLPRDTWQWCIEALHHLGYENGHVNETAVAANAHEREHVRAYISLRDKVRAHMLAGHTPQLQELPKPTNYTVKLSAKTEHAFTAAGEQLSDNRPTRMEESGKLNVST